MVSTADQYFSTQTTDRDRAMFEIGIKLGALFHQFTGSPIINDQHAINKLTEGIEASIGSQPFVSSVKVSLNTLTTTDGKTNPFDYLEITGKNLRAQIELIYKTWLVVGEIRWIEELKYPLMYISKITKQEE